MTTSQQPWHGETNWGNGTIIRDAQGNNIGLFRDWQDAELVLNMLKNQAELAEQLEELARLTKSQRAQDIIDTCFDLCKGV